MKVVRDVATGAWGGVVQESSACRTGHPRFFPSLRKAVSWLTWGSSLRNLPSILLTAAVDPPFRSNGP